jgi:hypothetical protein
MASDGSFFLTSEKSIPVQIGALLRTGPYYFQRSHHLNTIIGTIHHFECHCQAYLDCDHPASAVALIFPIPSVSTFTFPIGGESRCNFSSDGSDAQIGLVLWLLINKLSIGDCGVPAILLCYF